MPADIPRAGPAPLGEFELIARFFRPLAAAEPGALALADDAAVLAIPEGRELVATCDMLVEGIHFLRGAPPGDIAPKALRANLSDLAAMGAAPRGYLLSAAFRRDAGADWIGAFAAALAADQARFGISLVGGDTVATDGPATFSITALGTVEKGRALRRAGANVGDLVYVSGTVGDAALGLAALQGRLQGLAAADAAALVERYHRPTPRLALGQALRGIASACIDVSDGAMADLGHICECSNAGAEIDAAQVPLSPAARAALVRDPALTIPILTGGDDYELLFAVPPAHEAALAAAARAAQTAVTRIGRIVAAQQGVRAIDASGRALALGAGGFRHF